MRAQLLARSLIAMAVLACASAHTRASSGNAAVPADATWGAYERYGLIALPFGAVGQFYFLAGATPDSTKVIFVVGGVPSDGLDLDLRRGGAIVHRFHMPYIKFSETFMLPPGVYDLTLGPYAQAVVVPRLGRISLAQPIPLTSTAVVGRDTAMAVYLEAYGTSDAPVTLCAPGWCDTLTLHPDGNVARDTIHVPLSRLAPGATTLFFARGRDTTKSQVFVGLWFPVTPSFDGSVDALRYLAPPERLDALKSTPADQRAQAWAAFMAQYKEQLPEYLRRIREANWRYGETGTPGWKTDLGSAYVQLGDPDQVFVEPHVEIWVYTRYFGRLKFDHKRLTPESHTMLETLVAQARSAR